MRSIQTSLEWLKGQYALKICQTPAARLVWKSLRETGGDRRLSRRDLARYLRPGAGVCGIARDRTADRELFAVISLDLGGLVQTDVGMKIDTAPIGSVGPHQ